MLFTEITLLISHYLIQLSEFLITKKTILSKKLSTKKHQHNGHIQVNAIPSNLSSSNQPKLLI